MANSTQPVLDILLAISGTPSATTVANYTGPNGPILDYSGLLRKVYYSLTDVQEALKRLKQVTATGDTNFNLISNVLLLLQQGVPSPPGLGMS